MAHEDLIKRIEESKFFKKYGCKSWRLCGSSTYIAPITDWAVSHEISIEIGLSKDFDIKEWRYCKYDGSCPQQYIIYYN